MVVDYDKNFDSKVDKLSDALVLVGFGRIEAEQKARLILLEKMREDAYGNNETKSYVLKDDNLISSPVTASKVLDIVSKIRRF